MTSPAPVMAPEQVFPGLMTQPSGKTRLRLRRKKAVKDNSGNSGVPPWHPEHGGNPESQPPQCDKCHVAKAKYEVTVDESLKLRLFLCRAHYEAQSASFTALNYKIRAL
jgi:hypothetical protein